MVANPYKWDFTEEDKSAAKPCYDGGTCRNEALVEDLVSALGIAKEALRQYQSGKTWPHIASDALAKVSEVMGDDLPRDD